MLPGASAQPPRHQPGPTGGAGDGLQSWGPDSIAGGGMSRDTGLELDGAGLRALVEGVLERLEPVLDGMADAPASWASDGEAEPSLSGPGDLAAAPLDAVLDDLFGRLPSGINTAAPGFMGYIPGGGLPHAAVADLLSGVLNRYVGISPPAPRLAAVERDAIRWLTTVVGLPPSAAGTFTSGGSAANLIGLVAAREARFPASDDDVADDLHRGTLYVSDQAHHSVMKAARFAGLRPRQIRVVPTDDQFRMHLPALQVMVAEDRRAGALPFLVVASAGTTNTGAVDPLGALADYCAAEGLWLHVDAAYGGFFGLTHRGREVLAGTGRADSVVLDPHKSMFLPYGTGAVLFREPRRVAALFSVAAEYLPPRDAGADVEASELGFELTRPFRGLRVWLPLRLAGEAAFVTALDEKLDLALSLHQALIEMPHVEVVAAPQLSTLAFACRRLGGEDDAGVNRRTRELLDRINASRRVLVTGTVLRGRFVIRPSVVSFRTHAGEVEALIDLVRAG